MKHLHAVLFIAHATVVNAQLINGSFEQNGLPSLAGWDLPCTCSMPTSSPDVPGGTGAWSFQMNSSTNNCICFIEGLHNQPVPWLTPGAWHLSGWIKGVGPDGLDATRVMVVEGTSGLNPTILATIATIDSIWVHAEQVFTVPVGSDPDSLFVVLFADGVVGGAERPVRFDDIQLDIVTGAFDPMPEARPAFRPNPATDKLWVDLEQMPTDVEIIDALGRRIAPAAFFHQEPTLEVDVSRAAPGICVLVLRTSAGIRRLRFLKG